VRRGTRQLVVTMASVLLILVPSLAWAAIWLEVHPDTAPLGTEVQVQLMGGVANQAGEEMPLLACPQFPQGPWALVQRQAPKCALHAVLG